MPQKGLYTHLKHAIVISLERKPIYAEKTYGQSVLLSNRLIRSEKLLLPVAKYFDWKGKLFNQKGIGIVADDFVSMEQIKPVETVPKYQDIASAESFLTMQTLLRDYGRQSSELVKQSEFSKLCDATASIMKQVDDTEKQAGAHFAMIKHLLESIGYGAMNAVEYADLSKGATNKLARRLLQLQLLGLTEGLKIDQAAQRIHQMGVGIIVNDVPSIPFLEQWQQTVS